MTTWLIVNCLTEESAEFDSAIRNCVRYKTLGWRQLRRVSALSTW